MEKIVILCLLIQCGILFQEVQSLSETNSTALWDRPIRNKRIIDTTPNRNEGFLNQDVHYVILIINESGQVLCTGTILTPRIIITAAHCVIHKKCFVESGGSRSRTATIHRVLTKLIHEGFDQRSLKNDITLLVIEEPIDVIHSYHRTIELYEGPLPPNSHGIVTGWGSISRRYPLQFPIKAHSINVGIISWQQCQRVYSYRNTFTSHEICTYYTNRTRCCWFGDSGGPLVVDGRLVGIFSWFRSNNQVGFPDVFMNLLHPDYKSWIVRWISHFQVYLNH